MGTSVMINGTWYKAGESGAGSRHLLHLVFHRVGLYSRTRRLGERPDRHGGIFIVDGDGHVCGLYRAAWVVSIRAEASPDLGQ